MRRTDFARFLLALLLLLLASPPSVAAADCTLRVGWEPYAPYTMVRADGSMTGADMDVIAALAGEVGCTLTFRELPWTRILLELEKGAIDLASSVSRTPEREAWGMFSIPYRVAEVAVFVRRGEAARHAFTRLEAIADLPFTLGIIQDYHYSVEFERMMQDPRFAARVETAANYPVNIQKLLFGRVDGVLADDVGVMLGEARTLGAEARIERLPFTVAAEPLHLLFSKATVPAERVRHVNDVIARMHADGRLRRLIEPYLR